MLKNLTGSETDTFDEVNKALNRIIDNLNLIETEVLASKKKKKKKKKGGK